MDEAYRIYEADCADFAAAGAIHAASWQASHRSVCTPEFIALHDRARQEAYLRGVVANGARLYLLAADRPLGIVTVNGSLISDLYVLPEAQRRGYGTALLRFAVSRCADVPTLWILENNICAYALYQRNGFRLTGRSNRLSPTLSEVEMSL